MGSSPVKINCVPLEHGFTALAWARIWIALHRNVCRALQRSHYTVVCCVGVWVLSLLGTEPDASGVPPVLPGLVCDLLRPETFLLTAFSTSFAQFVPVPSRVHAELVAPFQQFAEKHGPHGLLTQPSCLPAGQQRGVRLAVEGIASGSLWPIGCYSINNKHNPQNTIHKHTHCRRRAKRLAKIPKAQQSASHVYPATTQRREGSCRIAVSG